MGDHPVPLASRRQSAHHTTLIQRMVQRASNTAVTVGVAALLLLGTADASVHTVQRGDTLIHIARQYGKTVDELMLLNDIAHPDRIVVGDQIIVRGEPEIFVVRPGDSLSVIARAHGLTTRQLADINGIRNPDNITVGQELVVSATAFRHQVVSGDTVSGIAQKYGVTTQSLIAINDLAHPDRLQIGRVLLVPPTGGSMEAVSALGRATRVIQKFNRWPLTGVMTSPYGPRGGGRTHEGMDIAAPHGTTIRSVAAGHVTFAGAAGSYGLLVTIDHGGGIETRYAHASRLLIKAGETVVEGQPIARVGSTGRSTGPHLHFEVRVDGEAVNPVGWLP